MLGKIWKFMEYYYGFPFISFSNAKMGTQPKGFECGVLAALSFCVAAKDNCIPIWRFLPNP